MLRARRCGASASVRRSGATVIACLPPRHADARYALSMLPICTMPLPAACYYARRRQPLLLMRRGSADAAPYASVRCRYFIFIFADAPPHSIFDAIFFFLRRRYAIIFTCFSLRCFIELPCQFFAAAD
jgi:hypothetical protein